MTRGALGKIRLDRFAGSCVFSCRGFRRGRCRLGTIRAASRPIAPESMRLATARVHVERMWEHLSPATVRLVNSSAPRTMVTVHQKTETLPLPLAIADDTEMTVSLTMANNHWAMVTVPLVKLAVHWTMVMVHVTTAGPHGDQIAVHMLILAAHDARMTRRRGLATNQISIGWMTSSVDRTRRVGRPHRVHTCQAPEGGSV